MDHDFVLQIQGGGFMSQVFKHIHAAVTGKAGTPGQLFHYSAHDVTVGPIVKLLQGRYWKPFLPSFAASILFEVAKDPVSSDHIVNIIFNGERLQSLCSTSDDDKCTWTKFQALYGKYAVGTTEDLMKVCNAAQDVADTQTPSALFRAEATVAGVEFTAEVDMTFV
eukprot:GFYU01049090.1.p2 GENE.GFYU01049090.1~~GFYU01049090.1.p2  ORF type:complete len:189 (+),score=70.65 GFYU01049090.1:72-569(+)